MDLMPDRQHVIQALETWRRHRRNGTMPPARTVETIVGAAKEWVKTTKPKGCVCPYIQGHRIASVDCLVHPHPLYRRGRHEAQPDVNHGQ